MWEDLDHGSKSVSHSLPVLDNPSWFFPPLSSTCPSRTMSPPPFLSFIFCHFLSWEDLEEISSLNPPTLHLFSARCCCISLWVPLRFVFTSFSQILFISLFSLFPSVWFPSVYFFGSFPPLLCFVSSSLCFLPTHFNCSFSLLLSSLNHLLPSFLFTFILFRACFPCYLFICNLS